MQKLIWLFLIVIFLVLGGCSKGKDNLVLESGHIIDPDYPTTYFKLSDSDYNTLKSDFKKDKDSCFQTSINAFGFCSYSSDYNFNCLQCCMSFNKEKAKQMAMDFFEKNKKFTGILDTSEIKISSFQAFGKSILCNTQDSNIWNISIANQVVNGLEIENSGIYLRLNYYGVQEITGNWFPIVNIPGKNNFSYAEAKRALIGQKLDFMCWTNIHLEITDSTLWGVPVKQKLIYPVATDNSIELHVVWALQTGFFILYVDVMTGKLVGSVMTVIC